MICKILLISDKFLLTMSLSSLSSPLCCCKVCTGLFLSPLKKQHMAIHDLCLPVFLCEQCQMVFNRKLDLAKHRVDLHSGTKYKCRYCTRR